MPKLHVRHPITDLDTWLQAVNSLRSELSPRSLTDKGIVTFLFTDIEGSTRRWEADAAAMRAALEAHDLVLRGSIEAHGGEVFASTGDGMCAAFALPADAVEAAVAAQRALDLPVRMGIGTGEAQLRGGNYFGTPLNRTARVMAAGHGGQVLLDGATAALLNDADLIPLGPRQLRDITKPIDVFQVRAPGLPTDFPPLKTVDAAPGNLVLGNSSFIGRDADLAELQNAVEDNRLVTLTGPGGVGKTRLATELAARISDRFSDGVWVIDLANIGEPGAVHQAVATTLAATSPGRSRLVVFDNCEHVLDAVADVIGELLASAPKVNIIATSREGLSLPDECLWPVRPLNIEDSATLFNDRAEAQGVSFGTQDAATVAEICRLVDGLPLALELAAARLMSMTVTELREHLNDSIRLLAGSRRMITRHRTLCNAVQWSYDLLNESEKSLLVQCATFSEGFNLETFAAVGGDDGISALDRLDTLVRKSLLAVDRSSGRTHFSMLETTRRFVAGQGEVSAGRARITAFPPRVCMQTRTLAEVG